MTAINAFVERGMRDGWDAAGDEPNDRRRKLAARVIDQVRGANAAGDTSRLREDYPPAWEPFASMLEAQGRSLDPMACRAPGAVSPSGV